MDGWRELGLERGKKGRENELNKGRDLEQGREGTGRRRDNGYDRKDELSCVVGRGNRKEGSWRPRRELDEGRSWREGVEIKELKGGSLRDAGRGFDRGRERKELGWGRREGAGNLEGRREGSVVRPVIRMGGS